MSNITPFLFESHPVRVVTGDDGEPWVSARDVAAALEYPPSSLSNIKRLTDHVPFEWKDRYPMPTLGGEQESLFLSEQGVYFFVGRSDKPKALHFQKWVSGEVLPSIRKTGSYSIGQPTPSAPALPNFEDPVAAARAWADAKESEIKALAKLEEARPAVEFLGRYVEAQSNKGVREVAKILGAKESVFIQFLLDEHVMFRQSGRLLPYAEHQQAGRVTVKTGESKGHCFTQARFTPSGIAWIANKWDAFSRPMTNSNHGGNAARSLQ
jgi:prophage antirepressor-like protein